MARVKSEGARGHLGALALFAALAIGWTWPLAAHFTSAIPGLPGDNFSFVWNLWWMRQAVANPALSFFHTTYLFHPFGTSLVNHPHTALPALAGATLLSPLGVVTAHNTLLVAFVFLNMACAYALAWHLTRHCRASILAAVVFGLSPYLSAHLLGHFDLVAAWVLPLFALVFLHALERQSRAAAVGSGLILVVAAYTTYYYVVYLMALAIILGLGWLRPVSIGVARRERRFGRTRRALVVLAGVLAAVALMIALAGGTTMQIGSVVISMTRPQNPLTGAWLALLLWAVLAWRVAIRWNHEAPSRVRWSIQVMTLVTATFAVGTAPLLWLAAQLARSGDYVTQEYFWRSMPRGIDLLGPLALHPNHPLTRELSHRLYSAWQMDHVEAIAWLGVVPLALLALMRPDERSRQTVRIWWAVAVGFGILALGPILTVASVDVGLRLPAILLRFIPIVDNARMPGRAMVGVFLALAVLLAARIASARGKLASPMWQSIAIAAVIGEYWVAPIPLTLLDRPPALEALAREAPGTACEVPFGIGDGLSGVGSQDRRVLYDATIHEHPITGGYIGRMPPGAADRYERLPLVGDLLRLADGRAASGSAVLPAEVPCQYVIVRRAATPAMRDLIQQLPLSVIGEDEERTIYRVIR